MSEFNSLTFSEIENRIHAARLERSAALGEAIGGVVAQAWFAARRLLGVFAGHTRTLNARANASQPLSGRQRIAATH